MHYSLHYGTITLPLHLHYMKKAINFRIEEDKYLALKEKLGDRPVTDWFNSCVDKAISEDNSPEELVGIAIHVLQRVKNDLTPKETIYEDNFQ